MRRDVAMGYRAAGLTYREIAARMIEDGVVEPTYSYVQAHRDVDHSLKELHENTAHSAQEYTTLQLQRLDRLYYSVKDGVDSGDTKSVDTALRVVQAQTRLLGLEPTLRVQVDHAVSVQFLAFFEHLQNVFPPEVSSRVIGEAKKLPCLTVAASQIDSGEPEGVISLEAIQKIRTQIYGVWTTEDTDESTESPTP